MARVGRDARDVQLVRAVFARERHARMERETVEIHELKLEKVEDMGCVWSASAS